MERIASFFPRQGEWEMVRTPDRVAPGAVVERHRFSPGNTLAAISYGGPVCDSFGGVTGDIGPAGGVIVMQAHGERRWRYVGRSRFVPPGRRADSPIYVEWIRENGAWVVSRIGEEYWYAPRVIGEPAERHVTRDTTAGSGLPMERRYGSRAAWFIDSRLIEVEDHLYVKYGLPRTIDAGLLVRFGSVGVVPVFVEPAAARVPEVMYVLVGPDEYQPYMGFGHSTCRD